MTETMYAGKMPILALRGLCVFPEQTVHFEVGRDKSVKALEAAMRGDQTLLLIPQKDLLVDDPKIKDLYAIFSTMFHMIHRKIHIFHQLFNIFCSIWCSTDSCTDCDCLQFHICSAIIHNKNLFRNRFHQISGREKVISRQ